MPLVLHLSDLHLATQPGEEFGDYKRDLISRDHRQARRREIKATLTALGEYLTDAKERLDAVIVTGDVTYQNAEEGFAELGPTLALLKRALPPPDRIVVLPGNHDVLWGSSEGTAERYALFCKYVRDKFGFRTPLLEGIDITRAGARRAAAGVANPILDFREDGFVIIPINSANYCGVTDGAHPLAVLGEAALEDALGKLEAKDREPIAAWLKATMFDDVAHVTTAQLAAVRRAILELKDPGTFVVAALHHHLLPVSTTEEVKPFADITNLGQVRKFLAENVDVILHGHKHSELVYVDHIEELGETRQQSLVVSSGTSDARPGSVTMRLLRIEPEGARRTVRVDDVAGVGDGGSVQPRDRGSWYLPASRVDPAALMIAPAQSVQGQSASTCYEAVMGLFEVNRPPNGKRVDVTVQNLKCKVIDGATCHALPQGYPEITGRWHGWFDQTVAWWQGTERAEGTGYDFTHGERLYEHAGWFDQVKAAASLLAKDPTTTRGTMTLMEPARDLRSNLDFPSFCLVQPHVVDGVLHVTGTFRKQEMRYWWALNLAELAAIQDRLKEEIERQGDATVAIGSITTVAEYAVFSETPPKAVVPFLDFFEDDGNHEERIVAMAFAAVYGAQTSYPQAADDWRLVQAQWAPPETPAADADPVSVAGTERLARLVRLFEVQKGMAPRLAAHLDRIAAANSTFAARRKDPRPDRLVAFEAWARTLNEVLPKARTLIKRRLSREGQ